MSEIKLADLELNDDTWIPLPEELAVWQNVFDQSKPKPAQPGATQRILIDHDLYELRHVGTVVFPEDEESK